MKPASEGKSDLSRRTVYGYGLGEFGYSFYLILISSYLMFYMTDVLLLPTNLTGILYSAVQWVEAATAVAAGILIDNLFTSKGRYRPWIFRGSVICALSTALLYPRLPYVRLCPAASQSPSHPGGDQGGGLRQPLPLHRLCPHPQRHPGRRPAPGGGREIIPLIQIG